MKIKSIFIALGIILVILPFFGHSSILSTTSFIFLYSSGLLSPIASSKLLYFDKTVFPHSLQ